MLLTRSGVFVYSVSMDTDNIPLKSVAGLFNCKPSLRTLYRWVHEGVTVNGRQVLMEATYEGGRIYVHRDAVERFKRRVNFRRFRSQPYYEGKR